MSYERIEEIGSYWAARDTETGFPHVCWYDAEKRQTYRRSLGPITLELALAKIRNLVERGITGDPGDVLDDTPLRTVDELLDWHRPYTKTLASAEAERIQIDRLKRLLGKKHLAALVEEDFHAFRDTCVTDEAISIGTVSRTLTTLRSAMNRAVRNRRLKRDIVPHVPEYANKNYRRSTAPKARIMTLSELARLIDAIRDLHLLVFIVWLINTAARPGAILDFTAGQIDLARGLLTLNPAGRIQTPKYRPALPITTTLRPWCEDLAPGFLITWRGQAIKEIDTAFINACKRAGLPGGEGGYSIRHMLGRFMRQKGVLLEEIGVWLGHVAPPNSPETTLIYSPDEPEYLCNAKSAVEEFVRELNALTKRDLLTPPWKLV